MASRKGGGKKSTSSNQGGSSGKGKGKGGVESGGSSPTAWSDWVWDTARNQWGRYRKMSDGENEYEWQDQDLSSSSTGEEKKMKERGWETAENVTSIIQDSVAVEKRVKKFTSAESVTRSEDPVQTNGVKSVPKGVCALLFNMHSDGPADIQTRSVTIRTGPEKSGWYIIPVDEKDSIWGFAEFYYYWGTYRGK